jgi:DNA-directed RNA polymerase specialized sigma24 family protein
MGPNTDMGREAPVSLPASDPDPQASLGELFRSSWDDLVRLATFLTGSVPTAEDLVQDTFLRFGAGRILPDDPGRYLRTSVVNATRSYHRRRLLERRHRPGLPHPGLDHPSELWDILDRLSRRQRTALVLRYYLDLPEDDIATILHCRPATVRSLVKRGLAHLREELSP